MSKYGQYCPLSKTLDLIGEPWTMLLLRELLMGSTRTHELHRGLSKLTLPELAARLNTLERSNLVFQTSKNNTPEYHLTEKGKSLGPAIVELAKWGMENLNHQIDRHDLDIELLMLEIQRNISKEHLPFKSIAIQFYIPDQAKLKQWWLYADERAVDLSTQDMAIAPNIQLTGTTATLINIWLGNSTWHSAISNGTLKAVGSRTYIDTITSILGYSQFAAFNPSLHSNHEQIPCLPNAINH